MGLNLIFTLLSIMMAQKYCVNNNSQTSESNEVVTFID